MATGIFSTTRVAGEGIALAMVSAILAAFTQSRLRAGLSSSEFGDKIGSAAQSIATGDITSALAQLPDIQRTDLVNIYTDAFDSLLYLLIAITVISALVVFGFLGSSAQQHNEAAASASGE